MKRSLGLALALSLGATAHAAPRPRYGGAVTAHVFGPPVSATPNEARTTADRTAHAARFEGLFSLRGGEVRPVLARAVPVRRGRRIVVNLRPGVTLHDGRPLTAGLVAAALEQKRGTSAAFVLAPVAAIHADETQLSLHIDLVAEFDEYPRMLTSAHARIAAPADGGALVGTGPFLRSDPKARSEALRLTPFLEHRAGRPYLDALLLAPSPSRAATFSPGRGVAEHVLLGRPDRRRGRPTPAANPAPNPAPPVELTLVRCGDSQLVPAVDRALSRARLVRRFMDDSAQPVRRLLPTLARGARPAGPISKAGNAAPRRLLVAETDRAGWSFAKRVQLDLLRHGVPTELERVDAATHARRARAPGSDLVLTTVLVDAPRSDAPFDGLQALLSVASQLGDPTPIPTSRLAAFLAADPDTRRTRLDALETRIRSRLGLVPIAARAPGVLVRTRLQGARFDAFGAWHVEDAHRPEAPQ